MTDFKTTDMAKADWTKIPEHLRKGIHNYIYYGVPVGDFLTAVLENNLNRTIFTADERSYEGLRNIVSFLYWYAPDSCHGSKEIVLKWRETYGLKGQGFTGLPDMI